MTRRCLIRNAYQESMSVFSLSQSHNTEKKPTSLWSQRASAGRDLACSIFFAPAQAGIELAGGYIQLFADVQNSKESWVSSVRSHVMRIESFAF